MYKVNRHKTIWLAGGTLSALALLAGCGEETGPKEITEKRTLSAKEQIPIEEVTSEQRFHFALQQFGMPHEEPEGATPSAGPDTGGARLVWDTPEGWTEQPATQFRDVNFTVGERGEAEVYVSRMPGTAGGLAANINRWRGQMGLEPISEEEVEALPTVKLFESDATFIKLDGEFTGMGGAGAQKDFRMLGLMLNTPGGAVFVKMTGPRTLVEREEKNFLSFAESLGVQLGGS